MLPNTEEWAIARAGKVTASRIKDILPGKAGRYLKGRHLYMIEKCVELETGKPFQKFGGNSHTDRGHELEPVAIAAYEGRTGNFVEEMAIARHPTIECLQASPDGIIDEDGMTQIKAKLTPNTLFEHWECVTTGQMPEHHKPQVQTELMCADRKWSDFVSYCPQMAEARRLFIARIEPDAEYQKMIRAEVRKFWAEVLVMMEGLK